MRVFTLLCAAALLASHGFAQSSPSAISRSTGRVYGLFGGDWPNYGYQPLVGITEGGSIQWSRFLGVDGRVSEFRWGPSSFHQYFGVIGPRAAFFENRWSEDCSFEGGVAHVRYPAAYDPVSGYHAAGDGFAPAWLADGGLNYHLNARWDIRAVDFSYVRVDTLNGLDPKSLSIGLIYRIY